MSNSKRRIWTKDELIIAYYIAKWNYSGLKTTEDELVNYVIQNTTAASLFMQVSNFRNLITGSEEGLSNPSKLMAEIFDELANKTMIQVRNIVLDYMDSKEEDIKSIKVSKANAKVNEKRDKANAELQAVFDRKMAYKNKYQRLTKVVVVK